MMDMHSRNQYLRQLRIEYLRAKSKKGKGRLLDEARKRTGLNRKYLIRKLRHLSNLDKKKSMPRRRKQLYDGYVRAALVRCWEVFDYPCGQRLKPLLGQEVERLRELGELRCSDEVAQKLKTISARTIDEKLRRQKEMEGLKRKHRQNRHPLLYQKIPIKLSYEQDRTHLGNIQIDLVEHCGQSARGEYINTLSTTDISSGWWEGEAVMGRSQEAVFNGLKELRNRFPFALKEIHSDNGTEFINWHLLRYTQKEELGFSRSRPNKKNDNCFVEQKNWTHVKKYVGYFRYDTKAELEILNDLYRNELRLFKNFFQPVIKLISKERRGTRVHRKYDDPKTPYQGVMESQEVKGEVKQELMKAYISLNPAQLKRAIDDKLNKLYKVYQQKNKSQGVASIRKKLQPSTVTFLVADSKPVSVT
ncbi:MAG TPA: transposase [Thermodesulfobacteriota bacterium]|nr:transposase [Thermodesulfobacteriota bacterium]